MGGLGNKLPASLDSAFIGFTKEGGLWQKYINKTGLLSVKGTLVNTEASVDKGVNIVAADESDIIGVVYDDGIEDGEFIRVVTSGQAQVLLEDGTTATRGYWGRISITQAGRADITTAEPPGGTINAIDAHFREIGHCLESKIAGADVLAFVHLHFN